MTDSTQQTNTAQQSQSAPWQPTQGTLGGIIGGLNKLGTGITPGQSAAVGNLTGAANALPNFGGAVAGAANNLFQNIPQTLAPYLDPNYTNPFTNPALQSALGYLQNQVSDQVNGQFAAAGRDLSPANSRALAYGLGSAEAPLLLNQYNQNVQNQQGAISSLQNTYNTGAGLAGQQAGLQLNPSLMQLQAAQTAYGLPYSNLGTKEGMILPIAGLGGQTSQSGSANQTYTPSIMSDVGAGLKMLPQAAGAASGLFGGFNTPFFQNGWGVP